MSEKNLKVFYLSMISIAVLCISLIIVRTFIETNATNKIILESEKLNTKIEKQTKTIEINANKYLIYKIESQKILSSKNENTLSAIASLSKLVSVSTFLKTFKENNLNINDLKFTSIKSRIQKALVQSDNEDVEELGEIYKQIFNKDLLQESKKFLQTDLNITNFKFENLTGLDNQAIDESGNKKIEASNLMTANDLVKVFTYIFDNHRNIFEYTKFENLKTSDKKQVAINTNPNTQKTYGLLISKTGYTETALGNLGVIINFAPNENYLVLVLQSGKEERFADIQKLISAIPNF